MSLWFDSLNRAEVDFYYPSQKLVIEIDGKQHYTKLGLEYDRIGDAILVSYGLTVLRFSNEDIHCHFMKVCNTINAHLAKEKP